MQLESLTPSLLAVLEFVIEYTYFWRALPYKWDRENQNIYLPRLKKSNHCKWWRRNPFDLITWELVNILLFLNTIIVLVRYIQSILVDDEIFIFYAAQAVLVCGFLVVFVAQLTVRHKKLLIMNFVNAYLAHYTAFQGTLLTIKYLFLSNTLYYFQYSQKHIPRKTRQDHFGKLNLRFCCSYTLQSAYALPFWST